MGMHEAKKNTDPKITHTFQCFPDMSRRWRHQCYEWIEKKQNKQARVSSSSSPHEGRHGTINDQNFTPEKS